MNCADRAGTMALWAKMTSTQRFELSRFGVDDDVMNQEDLRELTK
jgi:hypothetical protein